MKVNTVVETPTGSAEFKGELSPNELQFIVEFGLNVLLQNGITVFDSNKSVLVKGSEELQ